jgi:hypothetical protein
MFPTRGSKGKCTGDPRVENAPEGERGLRCVTPFLLLVELRGVEPLAS